MRRITPKEILTKSHILKVFNLPFSFKLITYCSAYVSQNQKFSSCMRSLCNFNSNAKQSFKNYSLNENLFDIFICWFFIHIKQFPLRKEFYKQRYFFIKLHPGFFEKIQESLNTRTQNDRTVFWRAENIQFSSHKAACPTLHLIEQCVLTTKEGLI